MFNTTKAFACSSKLNSLPYRPINSSPFEVNFLHSLNKSRQGERWTKYPLLEQNKCQFSVMIYLIYPVSINVQTWPFTCCYGKMVINVL